MEGRREGMRGMSDVEENEARKWQEESDRKHRPANLGSPEWGELLNVSLWKNVI